MESVWQNKMLYKILALSQEAELNLDALLIIKLKKYYNNLSVKEDFTWNVLYYKIFNAYFIIKAYEVNFNFTP